MEPGGERNPGERPEGERPEGERPARRRPPDERVVWRRWLWGGLAVVFLGWFVSSVTFERSVFTSGPPVVPELPEAVAMDRPILEVDVRGDRDAYMEILTLEDARAPDPGDVDRIAEALTHAEPGIRRVAVRALGRLERPELVDRIVPALDDGDPVVRAEAANALVQAANAVEAANGASAGGAGDASLRAGEHLERALDEESDPRVQGGLARALGRLRLPDSSAEEVLDRRARRLLQVATLPPDEPGGTRHDERLLGVARGALFLFRGASAAQVGGVDWDTPARTDLEAELAELVVAPGTADPVRRAAAAARTAAGPAPAAWVAAALQASDPEVRRMGATAVRDRRDVEAALGDAHAAVRVEGVRGWARHLAPTAGCGPLVAALDDDSDHVAMAALDALGEAACGADETARLETEARPLVGRAAGESAPRWHRPVRALQALARHDPEAVLPMLADAATHGDPFVRAHVARIAGRLGPPAEPLLRTLADDFSANVREAALPGLVSVAGRDADPVLIYQLADPDPQVVRTAARLLAGSPATEVRTGALIGALERFTEGRRATDRDARVAVLERLADVWEGSTADVGHLRRWLADPDPRVAMAAAVVLERWTGLRHEPAPRGTLPGLRLPDWRTLQDLQSGLLLLELEGGGLGFGTRAQVRIRLLPFEAPTSAARVAGLARDGALDGLTLHRVAPNFVVQGGSPGANEYAGHGAYTRDELGQVGHWKGTVGVSTRGRDTGDGQLFVNVVDNLRLDHDYTVFGVVVEGLEYLESVQEGVRIRSARWEPWER
jgi:cyclophilin family peptidyl-prolyl cis-trans isomerase/HEAT repeat protein